MEVLTVAHGTDIGADALQLEACTNGGLLFQVDGDTDDLVHVCGLGRRFLCIAHLVQGLCGDGAVVDLLQLEADLGISAHRSRRKCEAGQHHGCQQQTKHSAEAFVFLHIVPP